MAAAEVLLSVCRVDGETPFVCRPCINAAPPPVLYTLAVSTPARRRSLNLGSLVLNLLSRSFWTETFLAVPAARPTPRDLTFWV